jgi:hypothetical protein
MWLFPDMPAIPTLKPLEITDDELDQSAAGLTASGTVERGAGG